MNDFPDFPDALIVKVADDIHRFGWSCLGVFPTEDAPGPTFAYTIGLRELDQHPEVIIIGLVFEQAHGILGCVYDAIKGGARYGDGDRSDLVLKNADVAFRALPTDGRPLNVARAYYELDELPALQVLWPDEHGRLPGEDGCEVEAEQDLEATRQ